MIYSKFWKQEFRKVATKIWLCHKATVLFDCDKTRHNLSKWILFSAIMVRKIEEAEKRDDKEVKEAQQELPEVYGDIELHPIIYKQTILVYARENVSEDTHFGLHHLNEMEVLISTIANKIIHSKDWILWNNSKNHKVKGFATSSENGNTQYLISVEDWIRVLWSCRQFYHEDY